jgi:hypothetical protein
MYTTNMINIILTLRSEFYVLEVNVVEVWALSLAFLVVDTAREQRNMAL